MRYADDLDEVELCLSVLTSPEPRCPVCGRLCVCHLLLCFGPCELGHVHPEDYPRDFRHVIALIPVTRPSRRVFASNGNEDGSGHNLHDLYHPSHPAHYVD